MRGFLITLAVLATGLTFFSALRYKSEIIEQDITQRVTKDLETQNAQSVAIDVDGRHVTLSGVVYDEAVEAKYLDTANDTYGALGPIDGLTYQRDGGFVTALKSDAGITLRGTVPDEQTRTELLARAALASDGEVDDQLTIAGPKTDPQTGWHQEAGFGIEQLAGLTTGTLTASAGAYVLSGQTSDNVDLATAQLAERDGWQAFISSPQAQIGLLQDLDRLKRDDVAKSTQIDDLTARAEGLVVERDTAIDELSALRANLTEGQGDIDRLRTDLLDTQASADTRAKTILDLNANVSDLEGRNLELVSELAGSNQKLTGATATIAALTATVASTQAQASQAETKVTDLEAILSDRDTTLGSTDARVVDLRATVATMATDLDTRDATIAVLADQVAGLTSQVEERDATIADLQGRLDDTTVAQASDDERVATLTQTVSERDDQIALLSNNLGARDDTIASLNSEVDAKDATIDALTGDVETRDATIAGINKTIIDREGTLAGQVAQLADLTATVDGKDVENTTLQGQVTDLTAVVAERDVTIASLRDQSTSKASSVAEQCATQASSVMEGSNINFRSGTARLDQRSFVLLERLTGIALACVGDDLTVEVGGHTDSQGSDTANANLSERRAQAVRSFMSERGVPEAGLRAVGYGESQPVATNNTAAGRAANRRISFEWQAR